MTARPASGRRLVLVSIAASSVLAIGVAILRAVNAEPVERSAEVVGNLAFAVVFAAPAFLGLLALRGRRPALLLAAGAVDLLLGAVSLLSGIGLSFLVVAALWFLAAARSGVAGSTFRAVVAVLLSVVLGTSAFVALFARDDPICWRTTTSGEQVRIDTAGLVSGSTISLPPGSTASGCSSDHITTAEGLGAIVIVVVMLGAVWLVTPPNGAGTASPEDAATDRGTR